MSRRQVEDAEIIRAIAVICADHGAATYRELADAVGFSSPSSVHARLRPLIERGIVSVNPHHQRSIRLTPVGETELRCAPTVLRYELEVRFSPTGEPPVEIVLQQA